MKISQVIETSCHRNKLQGFEREERELWGFEGEERIVEIRQRREHCRDEHKTNLEMEEEQEEEYRKKNVFSFIELQI